MNEKSIASRYAKALFDIAEEKKATVTFLNEWQMVVDTINNNSDAKTAFSERLIPVDEKKGLVKSLFSQDLDPLIMNFLYLLLDKGRETYLQYILTSFQELVDEKNGILVVKVKTTMSMEEKQKKEIIAAINDITGMKARLDISIDENIIGGMIMSIKDTIYDGSISGQLSLLKQHLAGSDIIEH